MKLPPYRWLLVVALAVIVNVGYGTIFYSFSVLLGEDAASGEFSRTLLSASLGLGVIASGMLAPLVGTLCDAGGPRRVFLVGAVLGAAGLAMFSRATEGWQVIVAWLLLLGPAMAAVFYEPAYVAIDQWFEGPQGKPLGLLTLVAGLSVTIFLPLTQWLVERFGWRDATLVLGVVLLTVVWALSLLVVRDRPREGAGLRDVNPKAVYKSVLEAFGYTDRTFWVISASFFLGLAATFALLFHQIAYLQDLGFPAGRVAAAVGVIGIISLPARFFIPALGDRVPPRLLMAVVFGVLALSGLLLFGTGQWWRVYLYIALFGTVFGAVLPMRAVIMSRYFSGELYGRMMGIQQSMLAFAIAGGPFVAGALRDAGGSYTVPWLVFTMMFAAAIPLVLTVQK
ncbi:MAG: MFS transporter [Rubrobacteraceae bacterium]